jgi:hypothetical protein
MDASPSEIVVAMVVSTTRFMNAGMNFLPGRSERRKRIPVLAPEGLICMFISLPEWRPIPLQFTVFWTVFWYGLICEKVFMVLVYP